MVLDCFTFFNEEDLLDLRLNILNPFVDLFVIIESTRTFSNKLKPFYFDSVETKDFESRILYVPYIATDFTENSFGNAFKQKEFILNVLNEWEVKDEDIIYYGDLDEIWKPQEITDDKIHNLEQLNYCYYLNNRSTERWVGTIVGKWGTIKTNTLSYWRANHTNEIKNAGWHFTNMGGIDQITKKLESYDHQEFNTSEIKENLLKRVKENRDYVGREFDWEGKPFKFWLDESQWPQYLKDNKEKYKHLCK